MGATKTAAPLSVDAEGSGSTALMRTAGHLLGLSDPQTTIKHQHEASLSLPRSYEETCPHLVDSVAIIKDQRDGGGC